MNYLLNIVLTGTILIPFLIGVFNYKYLNTPARIFFFLITVGAVNETIMVSLALLKIHNLFTLHFYSLAELILYTYFFRTMINEPKVKLVLYPIMIMIVAIAVGFAMVGTNLYTFNSIPRALECIFIISMVLFYFYELTIYSDARDPFTNGFFILAGCTLFYFSSSFIIFLFSNNVSMPNLFTMYGAHAWINGLCNLVFAIGLWTISRSYSIAR